MINNVKSATGLITGCALLFAAAACGGQYPRDLFQPVVINEAQTALTESPEVYSLPLTTESLQSRTFSLQYADAAEMLVMLKKHHAQWFAGNRMPEADRLTNSLFIEAAPDVLSRAEAWLTQMDQPQQQVQITAHIVSGSREGLHELGLQWGTVLPSPESGNRLQLHQARGNNTFTFNIARLGGHLLEMELSALEQEQQLDIIASPRLTTAHEHPASIKQGSEIPYTTQNHESGSQVQFREAVLGMEVTPQILRDNKVRLTLHISRNAPGAALIQNGSEQYAIDKQEITTQVVVRSGETLILGGIFQQDKGRQVTGVPYLSSIPLMGKLFTHQYDKLSRRELVIFITPQLIDI
ncbi:TPA: secretin N-terminal domain-containing protein [Morganella morganii]